MYEGAAISAIYLCLGCTSEHIQEPVPWCVLFVGHTVLLGETREEINAGLETWRQVLEAHGFLLSLSKTTYEM